MKSARKRALIFTACAQSARAFRCRITFHRFTRIMWVEESASDSVTIHSVRRCSSVVVTSHPQCEYQQNHTSSASFSAQRGRDEIDITHLRVTIARHQTVFSSPSITSVSSTSSPSLTVDLSTARDAPAVNDDDKARHRKDGIKGFQCRKLFNA